MQVTLNNISKIIDNAVPITKGSYVLLFYSGSKIIAVRQL